MKPSLRESIDSCVSTASQAEWFKPEQTLIIYDWDDTLCPSTWLRENRISFFKPTPPEPCFQKPLRELQAKVIQLLTDSLKLGKVVIVTNAMDPWVETSCKNFLPDAWPLVSQIPTVYARSIYETQHCDPVRSGARASNTAGKQARPGALPGLYTANGQNKLDSLGPRRPMEIDPLAWKEVAFKLELRSFYSRYKNQSWKNVLSIGDATFERDAVRRAVVQRPCTTKKCRTKTVKLLDDPDILELSQQVTLVTNIVSVAVQHDADLEIEIDEDDLQLEESSIASF